MITWKTEEKSFSFATKTVNIISPTTPTDNSLCSFQTKRTDLTASRLLCCSNEKSVNSILFIQNIWLVSFGFTAKSNSIFGIFCFVTRKKKSSATKTKKRTKEKGFRIWISLRIENSSRDKIRFNKRKRKKKCERISVSSEKFNNNDTKQWNASSTPFIHMFSRTIVWTLFGIFVQTNELRN